MLVKIVCALFLLGISGCGEIRQGMWGKDTSDGESSTEIDDSRREYLLKQRVFFESEIERLSNYKSCTNAGECGLQIISYECHNSFVAYSLSETDVDALVSTITRLEKTNSDLSDPDRVCSPGILYPSGVLCEKSLCEVGPTSIVS